MALRLGRSWHTGTRSVVGDSALDEVTARIVRRYANPARIAYAYVFRLVPGSTFDKVLPARETIMTAWIDEGEGLAQTSIERALERCAAVTKMAVPRPYNPHDFTPEQRKFLNSRTAQFTVYPSEDVIEVHLVSRSPVFTPKGDRQVIEKWARSADGEWYSVYQPKGAPEP